MKLVKTALGAALALGLMASAVATPIDTLFGTRNAESFLLTDTSGEILVPGDGRDIRVPANLALKTGDFLAGALNFENLSNPLSPIVSTGRELTAFFATKIDTIALPFGPLGGTADLLMVAPGSAFWAANLSPALYAGLTFLVGGVGNVDKVAGLVFEDTATSGFDRGNGIAASFGEATDGALRAVIGFDGVDDFWFARGPDSIAAFAAATTTTNALGQFNFGLSYLYENFAGDFLNQSAGFTQTELNSGGYGGSTIIGPLTASVQLIGDGSLFKPGAANSGVTDPFPVYNKVDISLAYNDVPEPGTMALVGLALIGLGFSRRRQSKIGA